MKRTSLFLCTALFSFNVFAQSDGPRIPSTATYSALGCLSCPGTEWNNWNNIMAPDGMYAEVGLNSFPTCFQTACYYSRYLMASNFGFTVPGSATIAGIKAEMLRMTSTSPNVKDTIVQLFTSGNFSTNHADTSAWTSFPLNITYGDSTDLWGMTLTPDSVNSINFGFRLMIRNGSPLAAFSPSSVDYIQMTVYYTLPTGNYSQTKSPGSFTVYPNPAKDELQIQSAEGKIERIDIYDTFGQLQNSGASHQTSVNISELSPGIYFAVINTGNKKIIRKFVRSAD